ncbi:hypothetical protein HS088_TW04G00557 [Tripterygium wilfordii]|uniref:Water stress and hypersensitive response domain-containing protein n=1 Tax=Tripterygium wilfordii TaxID=458696 RepID=A0A7J7DQP8_TRIWF|nr:uncharacterized protein LOC119997550 [Tripterygium wilfordii]KAF5748599.1 hypothetical protein HS088_TW04G00557 [Tripterygium wilfordii]
MAIKQDSSSTVYYVPLHPNVVVLSYYHRTPPCLLYLRRCVTFTVSVLLLSLLVFFLYPSDPSIKVVRLQLNHIRVNSSPKITLDLSFSLTIKVRNKNLFSLDYDSLLVSVGYRGRELGFARSQGGKLRARGSSYIDATLDLDGLEVVHDVFSLIGDLTRGVIPFETDTEVKGKLGLLLFNIPIQGRISCEVYVNTSNQTIVHQDCYPE